MSVSHIEGSSQRDPDRSVSLRRHQVSHPGCVTRDGLQRPRGPVAGNGQATARVLSLGQGRYGKDGPDSPRAKEPSILVSRRWATGDMPRVSHAIELTLYTEELVKPPEESRVHEARIFSTPVRGNQIALVNSLQHAEIYPDVVIGHSSGEIAAAYAVGALSLREAMTIAYYRGLATKDLPSTGGMAAIGLECFSSGAFPETRSYPLLRRTASSLDYGLRRPKVYGAAQYQLSNANSRKPCEAVESRYGLSLT